MDKQQPFNTLNDTISDRLFDYYRIAIDYGLDVDELTEQTLMEFENTSMKSLDKG